MKRSDRINIGELLDDLESCIFADGLDNIDLVGVRSVIARLRAFLFTL